MAKLSALVIPAVIDTSGVDKGISQIKSKLSRVGGGGGVGGVGGGLTPGHSAGIVPYGVGNGYGSGASAAMAAAFGAAAGQRAAGGGQLLSRNLATGNMPLPRGIPRSVANRYNLNNPISSIMTDFAAMRFAQRNAYGVKGMGPGYMGPVEGPFAGGRRGLDAVYQAKVSIPNAAAAQRAHMAGKAWQSRATNLGMWYGSQKWLPQGMGNVSLGGIGRALGVGAGIGAAYTAIQHFNPDNVQQRWNAPINQFRGGENYGALSQLKTKAEGMSGKYMGFGQAFDVGAQQAAGPYGTTFTERMSNAWGATAEGLGKMAGAGTTNPFYLGAMTVMPGASPALHAKMTEGIETAVGMGLLAVENTFKRLFN